MPVDKRKFVRYASKQIQGGLRMTCLAVGISRYCYRPDPHRDDEVINKLQQAAERHPAYGGGKLNIKELGTPMELQTSLSCLLFD